MDILTRDVQAETFKQMGLSLPTESGADEMLAVWRDAGRKSLYFFSTAILKWNKIQVNPHRPLCDFIQNVEPPHKRRKVLLIPRDTYKSTVGSKSLPLWILIQKEFCGLPGLEHRILLWSHASDNAKKQIKSIKQQIQGNDILKLLYPEIVPDITRTTWSDSNLLFPREGTYGEDTIEAAGIDTHLVSRHYTIQVKDDLEDKASYESPSVRQKVKDTYKTAESLFVDERQAYDLLIGTRWGHDDLYSDILRDESESYEFMARPLHWTREELESDWKEAAETKQPPTWGMDPDTFAPEGGKTYYFFPELFPAESCKRLRAKQGSFFYSMLYLNNPKDPSNADFNINDLGEWVYDDEGNILLFHHDGSKEVVPVDSCKRVLHWDPAMDAKSKKFGSRNAMTVTYKDTRGRLFLAEAYAEKKEPTLLFSRFIGFHQRHLVHVAAIEDVGFQRTLKFPLFYEMRRLNHVFHVEERAPIGSKETRIRGLLPYVETHNYFVRRGLADFREEMKGFPVFQTNDLLDSGAAALELFGLGAVQNEKQRKRSSVAEARRLDTRSATTGY